jgi:hypothetical protein
MMALTLEAEQRMESVDMIDFYEADADAWLATVQDAKEFVTRNFPEGALIRRDDVAKALIPILEVHQGFQDFRNERKLRPKYWIRDYADLLIDRTWDKLNEETGYG